MAISGFRVNNHPQQIDKRGAVDHVDDRRTDSAFIAQLEKRFGTFTLDVAASVENAKCEAFYSIAHSGLTHPWHGKVWCNPPYSDCGAWVRKAWDEWMIGRPDLIIMLLPANRTEQAWWQDLVEPNRDHVDSPLRTEFLRGRMRFDRPAATIGPKGDRPPFGCVLLIWEKE